MAERAISRRKRDGVYYTPDWLARYLVEQTVGARLRELRDELDLHTYARRLDEFAVVDPSCGAGALLLAAFELLIEQRRWLADALAQPFDARGAARAVLERNLHGVDLDREALALARTRLEQRAETSARTNLLCADALLQGWGRERFDCVIGNPPYVKLQHFRRIREDVANHLIDARNEDGSPRFESTQTGNFDLYLPFIEKGVSLLEPDGKLGYVAPSLWVVSEYGEGLRRFVRRTRSLARWIDFEAYQVFADATTYTALQFFSGRPQTQIRVGFAPRGPADLDADESTIAYAKLPESGAWPLLPADKLALWDKLRTRCDTLADACEAIAVGVQTSADAIYQLRLLRPGVYRTDAKLGAREVELEDAIMRPLISGREANRYEAPRTDTYVLFPYACACERPTLIDAERMREEFPLAWAYLSEHEQALRRRERGKMDRDDRWWGYNYPKNLAKQGLPKLLVAQTVPSLRVAYDERGEFCLDNVRVNGVFTADAERAWFLLGVLNGAVADTVFRATAKRKAGGYFEANKQYIAPLPIPRATMEQQRAVGERAKRLQALHSRRAGLVREASCDGDADELQATIAALEHELNRLLYALYELSDAEIALIEDR